MDSGQPGLPPSAASVSAVHTPEPEVDLALQLEAGPDDGEAAAIWTSLLQQWLAALAPELPAPLRSPAYTLGLSLVSDATITQLNNDWRQQEGATDVLAFAAQEEAPPLPADPGGDGWAVPLELGDIVISLETAARQAGEAGHPIEQELLFLASHGLLHLLGWDHPDEASLDAMLARQNDLLSNTAHLPLVAFASCDGGSSS
jgi:probable rRNA maturation factor